MQMFSRQASEASLKPDAYSHVLAIQTYWSFPQVSSFWTLKNGQKDVHFMSWPECLSLDHAQCWRHLGFLSYFPGALPWRHYLMSTVDEVRCASGALVTDADLWKTGFQVWLANWICSSLWISLQFKFRCCHFSASYACWWKEGLIKISSQNTLSDNIT